MLPHEEAYRYYARMVQQTERDIAELWPRRAERLGRRTTLRALIGMLRDYRMYRNYNHWHYMDELGRMKNENEKGA
jgi:hypothetical protein